MIIPAVKTAEDNLELFALKPQTRLEPRRGRQDRSAEDRIRLPEDHLAEVLDWSASNATRLFDTGFKAGLSFCDANAGKFSFAPGRG